MSRLRFNACAGVLDADLTDTATTIDLLAKLTHAAGDVPTITAPDYLPLSILGESGLAVEIVHLTAYTTGALTGTILRAQEGTTAVAHGSGSVVVHAPTIADWVDSSDFVDVAGDTMTGDLVVPNATADGHALNRITADARYVNVTGDTMTGALSLETSTAPIVDLYRTSLPINARRWRIAVGSDQRLVIQTTNDDGTNATSRLYIERSGETVLTGASRVGIPTASTGIPRLARTPNSATGDLGLPGFAGSDTGIRSYNSGTLRRTGNVVTYTGTGSPPSGFTNSESTGEKTYTTRDAWPASLPGTQVTAPAAWS